MKCVSICLLISLVSDKIWAQGVLVQLETRRVNGTTRTAADGKIFNAFYGIPYAIPPVGRFRFKAPIEAPPWLGTLDATKIPNICVQIPEGSVTTDGDEDCLTLNIYTPKNAKQGDNIPVIFYIFGGGFQYGSSLVYGPEHFMKRDIIIVMPNYRVGVLGFLSTGDDVISGNMGLKDQSMALKWVKYNIHFFGGDSNRITIQAHSSGAMCAHLHTLSPLSRGLYNRAIFQSGTGFCSAAFFDKDVMRSIAKEIAWKLGCNSSTSREMLNCFLNLQADVFPIVQEDLNVWNSYPGAVLRPTIENINAENPFLTTPPIKTEYESTDQEWMIGMTTGEGAYDTGSFISDNGRLAKVLNDHYKIIMPITLEYFWHSKHKYLDYISDSLRWHYFGNQEIGLNTSTGIRKLFGEGSFGYCTNDALRRYSGKKYVYLFDYISGYTLHQNLDNFGTFYGVGHADELPLLFYVPERSIYLHKPDRIFGDEMVKRWTNFAYSGDPNRPFTINGTIFGHWKPSTSPEVDFLRLTLNGSMETDLYSIDYHLWKHLPTFSKYD